VSGATGATARNERVLAVTVDEPGRRVVLQASVTSLPLWLLAVPVTAFPAFHLFSGRASWAGLAFLALAGAACSLVLVLCAWVPQALSVDAETTVLVHRNLMTGGDRRREIASRDLAGLTLSGFVPGGRSTLTTRLTLRVGSTGNAREWTSGLAVEGVDTRREVADLAYRLGAAAGLRHQRVVRSDARQIEVELAREAGPGLEPAPTPERPAQYARDVVSAAATAAANRDVVPRFDPRRFPGPYRVAAWEPGRLVRLVRRLSLIGALAIPVGLAAAAVVVWAVARPFLGGVSADGAFSLLVVGAAAAAITFGAVRTLRDARPRSVSFDFAGGRLDVSEWPSRRTLALDQVSALELRTLHTHVRGGRRGVPHDDYRCEVLVRHRQAPPILVACTRELRDDAMAPYRQALPLATELAEALGVRCEIVGGGK